MFNFLLNKFYGTSVLPELPLHKGNATPDIYNGDFTYFMYTAQNFNKTVLLFPGNKFSCYTNDRLLRELAKSLNAKLYCLEYRTSNNSEPSIEEVIDYCRRFTKSVLETVNQINRFYAIGHSLGCSLLLHVSETIRLENAVLLCPFINAPSFCCSYMCDPQPCIFTCSQPSLLNNYMLAANSNITNVYVIVADEDRVVDRFQSIQLLPRFYNSKNIQYLRTLIYTHDNILNVLQILSFLIN